MSSYTKPVYFIWMSHLLLFPYFLLQEMVVLMQSSKQWVSVFYHYFDTAFYFLSICRSLNTKCDKQKVVYRWALVRMWPQLSQCVPSCLLSFLLRSSSLPADTALINKSFSCGRHSAAENLFFWQQEIQLILGQNENSCPPEDPLCLVNSSWIVLSDNRGLKFT